MTVRSIAGAFTQQSRPIAQNAAAGISILQPFESGGPKRIIIVGGKIFNGKDLIKFKEALSTLPKINMNNVKEEHFFEGSFEI